VYCQAVFKTYYLQDPSPLTLDIYFLISRIANR